MKPCKNCKHRDTLKIGDAVGCPFQKICDKYNYNMYEKVKRCLVTEAKMSKERGMLFTKENRRKSVDGIKTQTRRIIQPQPKTEWNAVKPITTNAGVISWCFYNKDDPYDYGYIKCPHAVGDLWYQLEPFRVIRGDENMAGQPAGAELCITYSDDRSQAFKRITYAEWTKWLARKLPHAYTSSRFMYKSLSRYWYEITGIRVERVQDISGEDIRAEGVAELGCTTYRLNFQILWDSINKSRGFGWDVNPWVWCYTYNKQTAYNQLVKIGK